LPKLDELLYRERGLHITTVRHPKGFEYLMFEAPMRQERAIQKRLANHQSLTGYGWFGPLGQFKRDWSVARLEERFAREAVETG